MKNCLATSLLLLAGSALEASAFAPSVLPAAKTSSSELQVTNDIHDQQQQQPQQQPSRRYIISSIVAGSLALTSIPTLASARLEAVDRPDLLPSEKGLNVIQVEKFLTTGQAKRLDNLLASLEKDTGFRVRVLCQRYPNTPGLAIRDYWDLGKEVRDSRSDDEEGLP